MYHWINSHRSHTDCWTTATSQTACDLLVHIASFRLKHFLISLLHHLLWWVCMVYDASKADKHVGKCHWGSEPAHFAESQRNIRVYCIIKYLNASRCVFATSSFLDPASFSLSYSFYCVGVGWLHESVCVWAFVMELSEKTGKTFDRNPCLWWQNISRIIESGLMMAFHRCLTFKWEDPNSKFKLQKGLVILLRKRK